jgi:hypothetical protein
MIVFFSIEGAIYCKKFSNEWYFYVTGVWISAHLPLRRMPTMNVGILTEASVTLVHFVPKESLWDNPIPLIFTYSLLSFISLIFEP